MYRLLTIISIAFLVVSLGSERSSVLAKGFGFLQDLGEANFGRKGSDVIYVPTRFQHYKLNDLLAARNPMNVDERSIDSRMMELQARIELMNAMRFVPAGYGRFDFDAM